MGFHLNFNEQIYHSIPSKDIIERVSISLINICLIFILLSFLALVSLIKSSRQIVFLAFTADRPLSRKDVARDL